MKNFISYMAIVLIALGIILLLQIIPNYISSNDNRFYIGIALLFLSPFALYVVIKKIIKRVKNQ